MEDHVNVVAAVIIENGRILLAQRTADREFPMTWECTGGKVDDAEGVAEALVREVREELGIDVRVGRHIATLDFEKGAVRTACTLSFWHAERVDPAQPIKLDPTAAVAYGWFGSDAFVGLAKSGSLTLGNACIYPLLAGLIAQVWARETAGGLAGAALTVENVPAGEDRSLR